MALLWFKLLVTVVSLNRCPSNATIPCLAALMSPGVPRTVRWNVPFSSTVGGDHHTPENDAKRRAMGPLNEMSSRDSSAVASSTALTR